MPARAREPAHGYRPHYGHDPLLLRLQEQLQVLVQVDVRRPLGCHGIVDSLFLGRGQLVVKVQGLADALAE